MPTHAKMQSIMNLDKAKKYAILGGCIGALGFFSQIFIEGFYDHQYGWTRFLVWVVVTVASMILLRYRKMSHFIAIPLFGMIEGFKLTDLTAFTGWIFIAGIIWIISYAVAFYFGYIIFDRWKIRMSEKIGAAFIIVFMTTAIVGYSASTYIRWQDMRTMR
jgi:uncharacterized membrane protein